MYCNSCYDTYSTVEIMRMLREASVLMRTGYVHFDTEVLSDVHNSTLAGRRWHNGRICPQRYPSGFL